MGVGKKESATGASESFATNKVEDARLCLYSKVSFLATLLFRRSAAFRRSLAEPGPGDMSASIYH